MCIDSQWGLWETVMWQRLFISNWQNDEAGRENGQGVSLFTPFFQNQCDQINIISKCWWFGFIMIQHRADKGQLCSWVVFEAQAGLRLTHTSVVTDIVARYFLWRFMPWLLGMIFSYLSNILVYACVTHFSFITCFSFLDHVKITILLQNAVAKITSQIGSRPS